MLDVSRWSTSPCPTSVNVPPRWGPPEAAAGGTPRLPPPTTSVLTAAIPTSVCGTRDRLDQDIKSSSEQGDSWDKGVTYERLIANGVLLGLALVRDLLAGF